MYRLINHVCELPLDIVHAALSVFGYHKRRQMTALFEMNMFRSGVIKPATPHPGLEAFRLPVETWTDMTDYSILENLRMAEGLAQLGSEAGLPLTRRRLEGALKAS